MTNIIGKEAPHFAVLLVSMLTWGKRPYVKLSVIDLPAWTDLEAEVAANASLFIPYYLLITRGGGQKALSRTYNYTCSTEVAGVSRLYVGEIFKSLSFIQGVSFFIIQFKVSIFSFFGLNHHIGEHANS